MANRRFGLSKATRAVSASRSRPLRRIPVRKLSPTERYDANIDHILRAAAAVFADKSFGLASVRDIASRAQISFPRIYYYLRGKEELLYLISKRAFEELTRRANARLAGVDDPSARLKLFIRSHLEYHMDNLAEMKVLVREAETLSGDYAAEIARLKRDYSRMCQRIIEQLAASHGKTLDRTQSRIVTSLLFGAMNWFYNWYDPARDYNNRSRIMDEAYRMAAGSIALR
jgi:TetR/AcrR family transcriptional regulator, cholesterol catabolism regulator